MALNEPTPLPEKFYLPEGTEAKDLEGDDKVTYDLRVAEEARRKNPSVEGVAKEALACIAWLESKNRSSSEAWTEFGYSLPWTVAPAKAEEQRIVRELHQKPSKDIVMNEAVALEVADVQIKYNIDEYVAPTPEPEVLVEQ